MASLPSLSERTLTDVTAPVEEAVSSVLPTSSFVTFLLQFPQALPSFRLVRMVHDRSTFGRPFGPTTDLQFISPIRPISLMGQMGRMGLM